MSNNNPNNYYNFHEKDSSEYRIKSPNNNENNLTNTPKKILRLSKKKFNMLREITLETPKNKITEEEIPTTPNNNTINRENYNLKTKNSEIITINTEQTTKEQFHRTKKFLLNHKVLFKNIHKYEEAKYANKSYGFISSYAANTNQGQVRNYNEDRVSIILNVIKPNSRKNEEWPKVSFFGIYDGHGGNKCSDFLKENLHHYVCKIFFSNF